MEKQKGKRAQTGSDWRLGWLGFWQLKLPIKKQNKRNHHRWGSGCRSSHREGKAKPKATEMDFPEIWAIFGPGVAGAVFGAGWWFWVDAVVCSAVKVSFVHYLPGSSPISPLCMSPCCKLGCQGFDQCIVVRGAFFYLFFLNLFNLLFFGRHICIPGGFDVQFRKERGY